MVVRSREVVEAEDVVSSKEVVRAHDVDSTTRRRAVVRNILDDRNDSDDEGRRYPPVSHSQSTTKVKTTGYRMKTMPQRREPPRRYTSASESVHSVPELTSNSSITSTASTREETKHATVVLKGLASKRAQHQQQQRKSFTNYAVAAEEKRRQQLAAEEKRRQQRRHATSRRQTTDDISLSTPKSAFLKQPIRTESNMSNISSEDPYGALRTGNSSSLSQCYNTPRNLTYNLSGVLSPPPSSQSDPTPRQTAAAAPPRRPPPAAKKTTAASAQINDEISVLSTPSHKSTTNVTPHSVVQHHQSNECSEHRPSEHKNSSPSNRSVPDQQHSIGQEKRLNKDQEMAYYHYVTKRTVLQLVTEDLMSEKWKLVDYALYRLCELCCSDEHTPATTTGSVVHNNDPLPSSQSLSSESDSPAAANRIRFIKAGGHALIVGVMKKYEHVPDIQTSACRFIQHFLCRDKEGAFSELLGSVDGIERVLAALHFYLPGAAEQASSCSKSSSRDEQVHRYACGALTALVCSSAKMVQRLMKQPGNLSIFLAAMKVNGESNKEAVGTCRVLHFISTLPQYCDEIAAAGGIEDIVCEMKEYPAKTDVQVCGCGALANLVAAATQPVAMVELIVNRLHGAQLIGAAMKAFPDLEKLQEKGVQAIFVFSDFASIQGALKAASGLSILGAALENFPRNKVIQEKGSAAMKYLLEQMIKPKQED